MNLLRKIKRAFKKLKKVVKKVCRVFTFCDDETPDIPTPPSRSHYTTSSKEKDNASKNLMILCILSGSLVFLFGCSKNQDLKIVHNYWEKNPSIHEKKQQSMLDLYTYKKFKHTDGKEGITFYKAS